MTRKSHIYVASRIYLPEVHGMTYPPHYNASYLILDRYAKDLPEAAYKAFSELQQKQWAEEQRYRNYWRRCVLAFDNNEPIPSIKFGGTVKVDTSAVKGEHDRSSAARAALAVLEAGRTGTTSLEARHYGEKGGGISGALSKFHRAGVIVCLKRTR